MDTKAVIARFEAERQALALMDHPNIAKVLDAGATDTGRPYFVMELVRGIKITEYCDQNNLSTEQRLDLFVQICHAIQHAHQKGVIHRDIKPSNILVTVHDGKPLPKIIDFGIAKATSGQVLTDKTLFTAFEQFIGTPAYMSPEQAEMSTLDIDTRSDIYALGVLLYELLTGQTPFDAQELVAAGLNEMRRIIREQEPLRPSTRISTLEAADQTTVAKRRNLEPPQLIHVVRGDLDWIVMKCLEKDRTRRYDTANGLAHDILCHLKNEPVLARPPSKLYRFQKLVRRNKLVFAAGAGVVVALVIGLALSTWFFFQEREARHQAVAAEQKAKAEAAKSQQVAQFLQDMLKGVGPSVALGRDTTMLREILDKTAEQVGKDLKDSPEVEAELRTTLGEIYLQLGQWTKAEEMHRAALVIRRGLWGNMNTNVADSLEKLANTLEWQRRPDEAEPLIMEALMIRTNLLSEEHPKVAECLATLGDVRWDQLRRTDAEELYRHALAMRRKLLGNDSLEVADSLAQLGNFLISQGAAQDRPREAEADALEAMAIQKKLLGEECPDPNLGRSQIVLARALLSEGKLNQAETILRPILAMRRKLLGSESLLVTYPSMVLAQLLIQEGKLDEAEQVDREALATYDRLKAGNTPEGAHESISCMFTLADILQEKGKLAEVETLFHEAVETARKLPTSDNQAVELASIGDRFRTRGKLAEAEPLLREAIETGKKSPASDWQALALAELGDVLRDQGKLGEAEPLYREGLDICRQVSPNNFILRQWMTSSLSAILRNQGKLDEAESLCREIVEVGRKLPPSPYLAAALATLGDMLLEQGKPAEAEPLYREGLEICRQVCPDNFEWHQWLAGGLARVFRQQGKWAKAEPFYLEAITNSAKVWPHDFKKWEWQFNDLVYVLQRQGKTNEVERLRHEILPPAGPGRTPETTSTNETSTTKPAP
jgi:tetratricopeptide (TPR) repeat protein